MPNNISQTSNRPGVIMPSSTSLPRDIDIITKNDINKLHIQTDGNSNAYI